MSTNTGAGILALGEIKRAERAVSNAYAQAYKASAKAKEYADRAEAAENDLNGVMQNGQSQIHCLRAKDAAHKLVEEQLISALKNENPDHPLADQEVVDELIAQHLLKTIYSEDVISETFPSGNLPEGAVTISANGRPTMSGGAPGFSISNEERERRLTLVSAMNSLGFNNVSDAYDPTAVSNAIEKQRARIESQKNLLRLDDVKNFFTSMSKKERAKVEAALETSEKYLSVLDMALVDAIAYTKKIKLAEEKKARVAPKLSKLGIAMK